MSGRSKVASITLRDLRIAKLEKRQRIAPCRFEFEAFMNALSRFNGDDSKVPAEISLALTDCMASREKRAKPASVAFHLAKFINTKK